MADHFEEVIGLRLSELESRVEAEAESVKEHFLELQQFITFSLTRQSEELRTEWRAEFRRVDERFMAVEQRLDGVDRRLDGVDGRLDGVVQRLDRVEERLDKVDQKIDVYHEATKQILRDILNRLPGAPA